MPPPPNRRTVTVPLTLFRFSTLPDDLKKVCCLASDVTLDLHQPDTGFPERILGICQGCGAWYLMDMVPGQDEAVMVQVPAGQFFREALES